ncbi:MAG: hypothetical protein IOC39_05490 [Burkholderia sp.]|jgi:hypothetical protein|uniref:Imm8 family immunity protein n=1 Tax=Burkholderia TaxID=32008 RepID=UPI0015891E94|nr:MULTISPECIES: Imm8 family immunity protein [Burkholderia]MCA3773910.1 hypothetical protein [Cutibacterium sp.]MCA3778776.1 hypothetical protein [Burkholderia sp.]MCA3792025.1 hypothetical protein [Burkholderia sp.]MCA3803346.1 hypothetical protein [Burkholderia sp.]MCA3809288.1 hypothetical protein [Burkholderia sp.]
MKARLKSVDLGSEVGVFDYVPENCDCFSIWMNFTIGRVDSEGGDLFRLKVCTPDWLAKNSGGVVWGRYMLIVNGGYRPQEIVDFVGEFVSSLDENDWLALVEKISRVMEWEYEGYSQ